MMKPDGPTARRLTTLTPTTTKPVNIADAHKEFDFNAKGAKEEITAILNPLDAYRANALSDSVGTEVGKLRTDGKLPPGKHNNETDAFRHALWNYEMTKAFGRNKLRKLETPMNGAP